MTAWDEAIEASTFAFIEKLERRGFHADDRTLAGTVGEGDAAVRVRVDLPDAFPYAPPVVSPPDGFPGSWHRERTGAMCLYPTDGRDDLPWLDVEQFLALVARWIAESRSGWPGDFPDLDLERYFEQSADPLVVYGDLDVLNNRFVQLRREGSVTRLTGPGSIPKKKRIAKNRAFGYVTTIGEPSVPPTNWEDLTAAIPADDVKRIQTAVTEGRFSYLIVRYSRSGVEAAVVLGIWKDNAGGLGVASVRSASDALTTLTLRAGANATALADCRVAIVGVGAIGSFVGDLLGRSGVGAITGIDPDIVRPGNLIRYAAGSDAVGIDKPLAVKHLIESRPYNSTAVSVASGIPSPREVMNIFAEHDLVIDATAAGDATHLLAQAATAGGHRLLSVCIQEEGTVVRVDIVPPVEGASIPATVLGAPPSREGLRFEAGCGDPVSQTPAFAVVEAASLAARHAVGLLTGSPVSGAGTARDYR